LQSLADQLSGIEQKKSVIYFSSGMSQQGTDNQVQLRRTVDRANRANVSIYAADMRGLQAVVPGGDATTASTRGVSAFSGASMRNQGDRFVGLSGHADDDGGGHRRPRVLRFQFLRRPCSTASSTIRRRTTCLATAAATRRATGGSAASKVRLKRTDLKLEYRSGYYAPRDFAHSTKDDASSSCRISCCRTCRPRT